MTKTAPRKAPFFISTKHMEVLMLGEGQRIRKCIITFARSWAALAATRCLGRNGVKVITGDNSIAAAASLSRYSIEHFTYPEPDENPQAFIDKLVEVAKRHSSPDTDLVLMPTHTCIRQVIFNKHRFEGIAKLALPSIEQFETAYSKSLLARFCAENNILTPPTLIVDTPDEFGDKARFFRYPAFIKDPISLASLGLRKVQNTDEAVKCFYEWVKESKLHDRNQYPVMQEFVKGEDYCSTFLFEQGEPRASMTYHNILSFPRNCGIGAVRENVEAREMEAIGIELLRKLHWHGVAEMDFRWDDRSTPHLIEINPRFWGGMAQSIKSGWEYPYWLYKLAVEGTTQSYAPKAENVKTWNPALTVLLAGQELFKAKNHENDVDLAYAKFQEEYEEYKDDEFGILGALFKKMAILLDPHERLEAVKRIMEVERGAINEFITDDDPLPVLGLMYPLVAFLQHGKMSKEILVGKERLKNRE